MEDSVRFMLFYASILLSCKDEELADFIDNTASVNYVGGIPIDEALGHGYTCHTRGRGCGNCAGIERAWRRGNLYRSLYRKYCIQDSEKRTWRNGTCTWNR